MMSQIYENLKGYPTLNAVTVHTLAKIQQDLSKEQKQKKIKLCYITNFCPRRICSINNEYQNKQQEINKCIGRTNILERQKVLQEKTKKQNSRIPFVLTCVRTLPNVKRAIANNLDLVYVNREFKDMFQQSPISPLKRTELEQKPL